MPELENGQSLSTVNKTPLRNLLFLSSLALLEALQVLIIAGIISYFIPLDESMKKDLLVNYVPLFHPERETLLYRLFVAAGIVCQAGLLWFFRRRMADERLTASLRRFALVEVVLTGLMLFALSKMALYGPVRLVCLLFYAALGLSLALKVLWPWAQRMFVGLGASLEQESVERGWNRILDVLIPVAIFCFLFVPNRAGLVASIYQNERFYHSDSFVVGEAWAALKGLKLNVDIVAYYGTGLPIVIGQVSRWLGGFSYENVELAMILMAVIYFCLWYRLLRAWLGPAMLAAAGVLLAVKFQMFFRDEVNYFIWKHPSATVVRYFFDIFFFSALWEHLRRRSAGWLIAAAVCAGAGIFYVTDTGVYLTAAFYAYLACALLLPAARGNFPGRGRGALGIALASAVIPLATALVFFWLAVGDDLWTREYLANSTGFVALVMSGQGALPFYFGLQEGQGKDFLIGFGMALLYVFTLIATGGRLWLEKYDSRRMFALILSVYGLCLYHYFVCRSAPQNFYPVSVPAVMLACFWTADLLGSVPAARRRKILLGIFTVAVFSLLTSHAFIRYPNVLNLTGKTFKEERAFMAADLNIDEDARLIAGLTGPGDKVAVFSSFETAFLIRADRKPFFYHYPLINSRFLRMKDFGGIKLETYGQLQRILRQLDDERPQMIFVERKLILQEIPAVYYVQFPEMTRLIQYIRDHYTPVGQGHYLVACRRVK